MAVTWVTPAGSLGIIIERIVLDIPLSATSDVGAVTYSLIAGNLPRGLRLENGRIKGSPTEVKIFTESKFVIRASDGVDLEDRTFSLSVDGADIPEWITREGFLNVGPNNAYFVLDNAYVDFQLEATDTDITAGDVLTFSLVPSGGSLPPGLTLDSDGRIHGYTDPVFAVEYQQGATGAYDSQAFDILPLDKLESRSNGFDSYLYDGVVYDYSEASVAPRRLSRFYTFVVAVSDGVNEVRRLFRIYVVTEEFLQADNSILQVDTNLFQADASADRVPLWITESYLGRYRANNYLTVYLDVYDPPSLAGVITYLLMSKNPDGSDSVLPEGLVLDGTTGELAGKVPYQAAVTTSYQFTMRALSIPASVSASTYTYKGLWNSSTAYFVNDTIDYLGLTYICILDNRSKVPNFNADYWVLGVSSSEKTFTIDIIGEIDSAINWITPSDLGTIKPNQPSKLYVEAESLAYGGRTTYELVSGTLPPGLTISSNGYIQGKIKQFGDSAGPGLTRFYDIIDGSQSFTTTFDGNSTLFGRKFTFGIKAKDSSAYSESVKQFYVTVVTDTDKTFANLYLKAFQSKNKRLDWFNFITNASIFKDSEIYRFGDEHFGVQTELKILLYSGIESVSAVRYVQAMSRNHYNKRILFGNVKAAKAKDPVTQETIYEVVYVDIIDEYEKNGISISNQIDLPDNINSKVLVSYDAIKIDSDIPLVSDSDHQRIFPNSIKNMRARIKPLGDTDREYMPLWMRSIQDTATYELGYTKCLVLCYAKPGYSAGIVSRINSSGFDFKSLDFEADRYVIDILDGEIENKYLAFPQRGEKLP